MAALLVGMSVMAVLMSALLPVWSHMATREKEEELIFRGKQYARAIGLFQRKFANTPPPTIDVLVEQRFLRKKYKDPITNDDFQPIYANQAAISRPAAGPAAQRPGQQRATPAAPAQQPLQPGFGSTGVGAAGRHDRRDLEEQGRRRSRSTTAAPNTTSGRSSTFRRRSGRGSRGGPPGPGPSSAGPAAAAAAGHRSACSRVDRAGRPGQPPPPGFGQPNRPPINAPNTSVWQSPSGCRRCSHQPQPRRRGSSRSGQ